MSKFFTIINLVSEQEERDNDIEQNDGNNGAAIEAELGTHNGRFIAAFIRLKFLNLFF